MTIVRIVILVLCLPWAATADDPPRLEPTLDTQAGRAWAWTSAAGLRYTWVLPGGMAQGEKRDLVVICHGSGLDYRWGAANNKPGEFRPDDIVVSVDGPSPGSNESRLFMGSKEDGEAFASFLTEMRAAFPVRHVYLYGHSQGGFFVAFFMGEHPDAVDGVVAHASGAWNWSRLPEEALRVPIVFMHGTADVVVPYGQSVGARDWYREKGHPMVHLRRLPGYNHWPNATRAGECIDWCRGMRTDDPAEALASARAILKPKPADEYEYQCPVWFSGAADVLRRLMKVGVFADSPGLEAARREAGDLLARIEAEGTRHVDVLRKDVSAREDLTLDGGAWIGHLVAIREDFRGVGPVEDYMKEIGFDDELAKQSKASVELVQRWYRGGNAGDIFETVVRLLPECFLVDGLPAPLDEQVPKVFAEARQHGISPEAISRYGNFLRWKMGRESGRRRYQAMWSEWE